MMVHLTEHLPVFISFFSFPTVVNAIMELTM
jgi:hypothetical protein